MKIRPGLGFYFTVDFIVTIVVISVVLSAIVSAINESRKSIEVAAASAEVLGIYRVPLSTYYALNGEWPTSMEELQQMIPEKAKNTTLSLAENVRITQGAITVDMRKRLSGKTLTIHPAVLAGDPFGPVKWVAGGRSLSPGWTVVGDDGTTVDEKYIGWLLKR